MGNVSSVKLTAPKTVSGEILRKELRDAVLNSQKKLTYIHAGAGYGKTTLLSQISHSRKNTVWLSLDGEHDVFTFINTLKKAIHRPFPDYEFTISDYLPFEGKNNFITILANTLINSMERLAEGFMIVLDDLHTIKDQQIKEFITCVIKYKPENIQLCLSSRESPWQELVAERVRGNILELTQKELRFTKSEVIQVMGFDDRNIYNITEGWPLAICSFKVLLENGVSIDDIPAQGHEALYSYLCYECISHLSCEIVDFLQTTACFEELDAQMLDAVLNTKNTRLILENLVSRNIFTIKTGVRQYRYHALFRDYLLEGVEDFEKHLLQNKAVFYYYNKKHYSKAAQYAILSGNMEMLQQIILAGYKSYIKNCNFSELCIWFQVLVNKDAVLSQEVLVAKSAFLSIIGKFSDAKKCLDSLIPLIGNDDELYIEAMVHKARVLRNFVSFEESNKLLDKILLRTNNLASDLSYTIVIEKVYNFCWNSQVREAYATLYKMIETCANKGDMKVKAWYERYLTAVHFFAGRMKDAVSYYEKSLELPENERQYLDMHNVGIYAAKAYQMLGNQNKAVSIISTELKTIRSTGRFEEMCVSYLLAAAIHYHIAFIDRINGGCETYEIAVKYFILADEYAPFYRTTKFQMQWAKMQRLVCSLMFLNSTEEEKQNIIKEILLNLENVTDYLKTIVLGRLFSYYAAVSDFPNAIKYAKLSIEIGERSNNMLIPTIAYGILANAAIAAKDHHQAVLLTKHYLKLCSENGIYEFFRMQKTYDLILEFALDNEIDPDFTKQMVEFAGYKTKKLSIQSLGQFSVFPYKNRQEPIKMRTKKERELLAFLLDASEEGVTKEQIFEAIWYESESNDVKKLIGVNLSQIKKDLAKLGIENPITNSSNYYSICRDEIEYDVDLLEAAIVEFENTNSTESANNILKLYKGQYLSDFEALWATAKRIKYSLVYERAFKLIKRTK